MKKVEFIFIPVPGYGHLLPVLEFASRLIDQDDRIQITIVSMKLWGQTHLDHYARSLASSHPFVQLVDVPELDELDSTELGTQPMEAYIYAVMEKNIPVVRDVVTGILSSRNLDGVLVKGLVLDFFSVPMIEIAKEVNLPSYVFWTTNAGTLALVQHLAERHGQNTLVFQPNSEDRLLIPGLESPVPPKVLPPALFYPDGYDAFIKLGKRLAEAKGIIVNTFTELEPYAVNYFLSAQGFQSVYAIGPVLWQKAHPPPDGDLTPHDKVIKWLDDQPEASVVFLCFGSGGSFEAPQVKEIAHGLVLCGYRFLWSLRPQEPAASEGPNDDLMPEGFLDRVSGRGMVCGWAPQVEILAHKAIGGFVSHCGWNSILESLWFGVPIVTWPIYAEQQLNAFRMVKELGLAVEMRLDFSMFSNELVTASEIETAIRCLMQDHKEVKKKVKEISLVARKAVMEGGSSFVAIGRFIQDVLGSRG